MKHLVEKINSYICILFIVFNTIFWVILSLTSIIYSPSGRFAYLCMRWWSNTSLWFCRIKVFVDGLENVNKDKVQIFASNHSSHFDVFILGSVLPVQFGWVGKKELFKIPLLGWHMKLQGYVSIDRSNREKAIESLNIAAEKIRNGSRIAIFPEGTRSRGGEMLPFKKGLFHLCVKTRVPMLPIMIKGTYEVLKPKTTMIRPGNVYVKIGRELQTRGYISEKIDDIMEDLRERMIHLKKEVDEFEKRVLERCNAGLN